MKKKNLDESSFYQTTDMNLCVSLCACGCVIEGVNRQNPAKVVFLIKKSKNLESLVRQYFSHQLKVDPSMLFFYLKQIKTMIYNS
jgi:hypothetical protein